ncbi:MAG: phospholipid carrier-dependent glycosyltransferase [Candidatus Riflebacteria bacterium]|nr:phospholipid carrier-dependent glycosyltransferase [Candidatus Riflebacteria bacterium]
MNTLKLNEKILLLLLIGGVYFLSISGRQTSPDEEDLYRSTYRFSTDFSLVSKQMSTVPTGYFLIHGNDGRNYSIFGPGLLPLHFPLVFAGLKSFGTNFCNLRNDREQPFGEAEYPNCEARFWFSFAGPIAGVLISLFMLRLCGIFGLSRGWTLLAVLSVGLCTPIWAYTKTAFRDLPLTAFILAGICETIVAHRKKSKYRSLLAGIFFGLAYSAKEQAGFHFLIALFFLVRVSGFSGIIAAILGFFAASLPLQAFKIFLLGGIFKPLGGDFSELLITPFLEGISGLLLSPGKGIIAYSPFLLFAYPGIKKMLNRNREETWFLLSNLVILFCISSIFMHWHGGLCWGPRLVLPAFPILVFFAILSLSDKQFSENKMSNLHQGISSTRKGKKNESSIANLQDDCSNTRELIPHGKQIFQIFRESEKHSTGENNRHFDKAETQGDKNTLERKTKFGNLFAGESFARLIFFVGLIWGLMVNFAGLSLDWHLYHVLQEYRYQTLLGGTEFSFFDKVAWSFDDGMIATGLKSTGLFSETLPPSELAGTPAEKAWPILFHSRENLALLALKSGKAKPIIFFGIFVIIVVLSLTGLLLQFRRIPTGSPSQS